MNLIYSTSSKLLFLGAASISTALYGKYLYQALIELNGKDDEKNSDKTETIKQGENGERSLIKYDGTGFRIMECLEQNAKNEDGRKFENDKHVTHESDSSIENIQISTESSKTEHSEKKIKRCKSKTTLVDNPLILGNSGNSGNTWILGDFKILSQTGVEWIRSLKEDTSLLYVVLLNSECGLSQMEYKLYVKSLSQRAYLNLVTNMDLNDINQITHWLCNREGSRVVKVNDESDLLRLYRSAKTRGVLRLLNRDQMGGTCVALALGPSRAKDVKMLLSDSLLSSQVSLANKMKNTKN